MGLVIMYEMGYFLKPVYNHQHGVFVALSPWESKHKIHASIWPWSLRSRQWSINPLRKYMAYGHLTNGTSLDKVLNVFEHVRLKVVLFGHNVRLVFSKVTGKPP